MGNNDCQGIPTQTDGAITWAMIERAAIGFKEKMTGYIEPPRLLVNQDQYRNMRLGFPGTRKELREKRRRFRKTAHRQWESLHWHYTVLATSCALVNPHRAMRIMKLAELSHKKSEIAAEQWWKSFGLKAARDL